MTKFGEIILGGGGNEEEDFKVLKYFCKNLKNILYIPNAFPDNKYKNCLIWAKNNFKRFDLEDKITMHTNLSSDIDLSKFDGIYIGGGNTFKLLKEIKESGFDKKIIKFYEKGGKIAGGSAGSIIFGNNIKIAIICEDKDKNLVNLKNLSGINICKNYDIQAHYFDEQLREHQDYIKNNKRNVIAIPNESAVVISNNKFKVIGKKEVTIISIKNTLKFDIGTEIDLDKLYDCKIKNIKYREPIKYPAIIKDVAFLVNEEVMSADIEKVIKKAGGRLLETIDVFDVYQKDEQKSIAYSLTFRDEKTTLSDEEVMIIFNRIIGAVEEKVGAKVRDN